MENHMYFGGMWAFIDGLMVWYVKAQSPACYKTLRAFDGGRTYTIHWWTSASNKIAQADLETHQEPFYGAI